MSDSILDISNQKKREQMLMVAAALLFALVAVPFLYYYFIGDIKKLTATRNKLRSDVKTLAAVEQDGIKTKARLADLLESSLPSRESIAVAEYQKWLLDLARDKVKLIETNVAPQGSPSAFPRQNRIHYKAVTFTLTGKGTLKQFSEFLALFEEANFLHAIRRAKPTAVQRTGPSASNAASTDSLNLTFTIEALIIPQAKETTTLNTAPKPNALSPEETATKIDEIVTRNLFAAWRPPQPPAPIVEQRTPPPPTVFDDARFCFVDNILVGIDGIPRVWITVRTQGITHKLAVGESFMLGRRHCAIVSINFNPDFVVIEVGTGDDDKQKYSYRTGKSLLQYD